MKKILKIVSISIVILLILLITLPFVFKDKIITTVKDKINENINAKVEFSDLSLSFIKNFPNASVTLSDLSVVNFKPFEGDTLVYSKEIKLKTSIMDVVKGKLDINYFALNDAKVNVLVNENGKANYDIAKPSKEEKAEKSEGGAFKIGIDSYEINDVTIRYHDKKSKMLVELNELNHYGSGDLSSERTKLDTHTSTDLKFVMNKTAFVDGLHLDLKALLDLDLKNQKFAFLENEAHINQLPLIFDGFVKLNDKNQEVKLNFKTPSSDFKNFLALVPKAYAKNTEMVKTTGKFEVIGKVDGIVDEKHIPKLAIKIASNNASFKFPDLPKGVNNITIDTDIKNTTGLLKDMAVDINKIAFKIDDNSFNASSKIRNLMRNPYVDATLKGKLNLADIKKVYPLEKDMNLTGIIDADLNTKFDLQAVQKSVPERIKNQGNISLHQFEFSSKDMNNPFFIQTAQVDFQPKTISLTDFQAKTGKSDIKAKGTLQNVIGFVLADKKLKGNFSLSSDTFNVTDFMQSGTETVKKEDLKDVKSEKKIETGELKIPDFLDITTNVTAKKVLYDNLTLSNVSGAMIVRDQKAILKNLKANMFEGRIAFNGSIDTKPKTPNFDMKMGIKEFNIASSFKSMEMLRKIAPIAEVISGKFNTDINLKGKLTKDLMPDLNTLGGNALAELLDHKIDPEKSKVMNLLGSKLKFFDLKKLNLKHLKANLSFSDGKVNLKPINLKYRDININLGGSHGFNQQINYDVKFDVPAKYLGKEATGLLTKLDKSNQNMTIPVTANLTGDFSKPVVKTDMKSAITNLTNQLVEQQKTRLKNKAVDQIKKQINNKQVNNVLDGVLGKSEEGKNDKKPVKKRVEDQVKKKAKKELNKVLGGLFK